MHAPTTYRRAQRLGGLLSDRKAVLEQVSVTPCSSTNLPEEARRGGTSFDFRPTMSMDDTGEDEDAEDVERDEDPLRSFNPTKAHEMFVWMALNGQSLEVRCGIKCKYSASLCRHQARADEPLPFPSYMDSTVTGGPDLTDSHAGMTGTRTRLISRYVGKQAP